MPPCGPQQNLVPILGIALSLHGVLCLDWGGGKTMRLGLAQRAPDKTMILHHIPSGTSESPVGTAGTGGQSTAAGYVDAGVWPDTGSGMTSDYAGGGTRRIRPGQCG